MAALRHADNGALSRAPVASGNSFRATPFPTPCTPAELPAAVRLSRLPSRLHCHHAAAVTNCFNIDLKTKTQWRRRGKRPTFHTTATKRHSADALIPLPATRCPLPCCSVHSESVLSLRCRLSSAIALPISQGQPPQRRCSIDLLGWGRPCCWRLNKLNAFSIFNKARRITKPKTKVVQSARLADTQFEEQIFQIMLSWLWVSC